MPSWTGHARMGGVELKDAMSRTLAFTTALVLMTDLAWRYDLNKPEAAGFCAALSKPVHENNLLDCLYSALNIGREPFLIRRLRHRQQAPGPRPGASFWPRTISSTRRWPWPCSTWAGYQVDTVVDGVAAVEANRAQRYDLILMDCQMPALSGYEATAAIRAEEGAPSRHTPIAAMTAGARSEDRAHCLASGMDSYLAKPVRKDTLLQLVAASTSDWLQVAEETLGVEPRLRTTSSSIGSSSTKYAVWSTCRGRTSSLSWSGPVHL